MAIHHTTFVLPAAVLGLGYDTPFLVLGAETAEEVDSIPCVTSLHRIGNSVMPFMHASPVLGELPVSDTWAEAAVKYDDACKVVLLREPVPRDISTEYAEITEGVLGPDLPPWVGMLLYQELHVVSRDVPVSKGASALSIGVDVKAPTSLPAWADQTITPVRD